MILDRGFCPKCLMRLGKSSPEGLVEVKQRLGGVLFVLCLLWVLMYRHQEISRVMQELL